MANNTKAPAPYAKPPAGGGLLGGNPYAPAPEIYSQSGLAAAVGSGQTPYGVNRQGMSGGLSDIDSEIGDDPSNDPISGAIPGKQWNADGTPRTRDMGGQLPGDVAADTARINAQLRDRGWLGRYQIGGSASAQGARETAAAADAAAERASVGAQTTANRPGQVGPNGRVTWKQDPVTGEWTQTTSFSPELTGANDSAQAALAESLRTPLQDGQQARDQAITAAYGQATSRLDPQWAKREEANRTLMLNQGLDPNSQASQGAASELGMQRNDAYTSAMNSAIGQGTAAGDSVFRNSLAAKQYPLGQLQGMADLLRQPDFNAAGRAGASQNLEAANMTSAEIMTKFGIETAAEAEKFKALVAAGSTVAEAFLELADSRAPKKVA